MPAHAVKPRHHALELSLRASGTRGTLSGRPFGKGNVTIETEPPQYYLMTWKFPHGTIVLLVWLPDAAKGTLSGRACHWVIGGGTGRYRGIRGSGVMTGTTDGRVWRVVAQAVVTF